MATEKLQMTAVGVPDGWTQSGGASKMAAVAEPHDADATFIHSEEIAENIQEFSVVNTTGAIAANALISSVKIHARCRRGAAEVGDANFILTTVLGVNSSDGAAHTAPVGFADFFSTFAAKPGGGAWTKADVDALKIRIRNTEAQDVDCTTLYVEVTYTAFPGTARALTTIASQFGIEVTPGDPVAANRFYQALSLMPRLSRETKPFRPRGRKYPTLNVPHKTSGVGTYEAVGCYNAMGVILSCLLPNPTAQVIGATAAYRRTYLAVGNQGDDDRLTLTTEVGSAVAVDRYALTQLASMLFALGQDDVAITGNLFARAPAFNQVQTPDPEVRVARPIQRGQINVFLDAGFANRGNTKVADSMAETISMGDKWAPVWTHNTDSSSFRNVVELAPELVFSFITPHNSQSRDYLDSLQDDELHYMRIQATGAEIADDAGTPVHEQLTFDIAGKFDTVEEQSEQEVYGMQYSFRALDDPDLGGPFTAELINLLPTL